MIATRYDVLKSTLPPELIKEVILHSSVYCGIPAANTAFHLAGLR